MNNPLLNEKVFIRFIDTPGFDTGRDVRITKREIEKIFEDFDKGKERIPVILYFLTNGQNFSRDNDRNELDILDYLKTKNSKILFIITRCPDEEWEQLDSFLLFLQEKNLESLVEDDRSNIFPCNLKGRNAFGVKEIFKKLYNMLNTINGEEVYNDSLINEIKERPTFDEKLSLIKQKTSLFNQFESKNDIITYANIKAKALISSLSFAAGLAGAIPIPFVDIAIIHGLIITAILSIGHFYGYIYKKISRNDIISIFDGRLYDHNIDQSAEEYFDANGSNIDRALLNNSEQSDNNAIRTGIGGFIISLLSKGVLTSIALFGDDGIKLIPGLGSVIGSILGSICDFALVMIYSNNANKYFKSKCEADDGTLFFCSRCYEYEAIFKKFKNFEIYDLIYP